MSTNMCASMSQHIYSNNLLCSMPSSIYETCCLNRYFVEFTTLNVTISGAFTVACAHGGKESQRLMLHSGAA